jgi:hypothetical protein
LTGELIDRIVDGVLSPAELRVALQCLEQTHDGWKRCALAFLEASCWGEAMRTLGAPDALRAGAPSVGRAGGTVPPDRPHVRWLRGLAAAAAVALSFAIGWLSHPRAPESGLGGSVVAQSGPADDSITRPRQHLVGVIPPAWNGSELARQARTASLPIEDRSIPAPVEAVHTVGQIQIGPDDSGPVVPILAGPGLDGGWLQAQPPPISEYTQAVLQRRGYQIDQRRRLLSVLLSDGRRIIVPVDQVHLLYTGKNPL